MRRAHLAVGLAAACSVGVAAGAALALREAPPTLRSLAGATGRAAVAVTASAPQSPSPSPSPSPSLSPPPPPPPSLSPSPSPPPPPSPASPRTRARVVIDPGHGGTNTGCAGVVEGVYEKRFTLALSLALAARLRAAGVDVVLTREEDRYLTLRERGRLANQADADLFVSVHANASPGHAQRGFETWVLTPEAIDVDARAIRAGDGPARPGLDPELALVLDDVERGAAHEPSVRLAERMQLALAEVWGAERSRGVRQGAQDVLMGLTIPGVLVEVGFLDHPIEGTELLRSETRDALADALAEAILDYLRVA